MTGQVDVSFSIVAVIFVGCVLFSISVTFRIGGELYQMTQQVIALWMTYAGERRDGGYMKHEAHYQ
ncbi:unnamed protein product [Orchesella dallaii]|uniref:Uncharacterized protein n=1 Tax=Orchesella dallaii TaxID=48710 RepID=A0ABP1QUR3_9HEXA